jgi:hypothetical protein
MKKARGLGFVYQPTYRDQVTGKQKTASTWWLQYSVRGKRYRESAGSSNQAVAVKLLKKRLGAAAEGRPVGPDIEKTTFEDLARILLDNYRANGRRSLSRVEDAVEHLREFFGDSMAIDIMEDRLSAYIVHRQDQEAAKCNYQSGAGSTETWIPARRQEGRTSAALPNAPREQHAERILRTGAISGSP